MFTLQSHSNNCFINYVKSQILEFEFNFINPSFFPYRFFIAFCLTYNFFFPPQKKDLKSNKYWQTLSEPLQT